MSENMSPIAMKGCNACDWCPVLSYTEKLYPQRQTGDADGCLELP